MPGLFRLCVFWCRNVCVCVCVFPINGTFIVGRKKRTKNAKKYFQVE